MKLTDTGLIITIITPLVFIMINLIEMQRKMEKKMRMACTAFLFVIMVVSSGIFYRCQFEPYFCFIWLITLLAGYPILYFLSYLGNRIENHVPKDLTVNEMEVGKKMVEKSYSNVQKILGISIVVAVMLNIFLKFFLLDVEHTMRLLSNILYILVGISFWVRGTSTKNSR